ISPSGLGRRHRGHSLFLFPPFARSRAGRASLGHAAACHAPDTVTPPGGGERTSATSGSASRKTASERPSGPSSGDLLAPLPLECKWAGATLTTSSIKPLLIGLYGW